MVFHGASFLCGPPRVRLPGFFFVTERMRLFLPPHPQLSVIPLGAAFLCARAGIFQAVEDNTAAYIASWLGKLRNDKTLVVRAAGKAQKAAAWILNEEAATKQETEG